MPKQTTDRLVGYGLQILHGDQPVADAKDGQPIFDAKGDPQTVEMWTVLLTDHTSGHTVVVPLDRGGRDAVVAGLSSGIVVANGMPSV